MILGQMLSDTEDAFDLRPSSENDSRPLHERVKDAVRSLPTHVSPEARSCLLGLLEINPTERLNSQESSTRFICNHPFFSARSKVDWEMVDEGLAKPLYKKLTVKINIDRFRCKRVRLFLVQICSIISNDVPFANLSLQRGEQAQEYWMRAWQSICTPAEEARYRSFDFVNNSTWSEFI